MFRLSGKMPHPVSIRSSWLTSMLRHQRIARDTGVRRSSTKAGWSTSTVRIRAS